MAVEWPPMVTEESDLAVVDWFEEVAANAAAVQLQTLRCIVESNLGAEYLQKWLGDAGVREMSPAEYLQKWLGDAGVREMSPAALQSIYTSAVPLVSHAEIEPYIDRIAHGDSGPVLTQNPITVLSLSSGTTDGRPKYVPFTRFSAQSTLQIFRLAAAYRSSVFPIRSGGRILEFIYSSKQFQTEGGLSAGTATTHYFASEEFKTKQKTTKCFTCSPQEVISGGDYKQSTYCHLLFGLLFRREVEFVASTFAYSIVQAFSAFEEVWEELCGDIREGTLSSKVASPGMRKAALAQLTAQSPALAEEIEEKCRDLRRSDWAGLIPALWPNAKYVYSIMTGSMQPYLKKLRHYAGGLPLVCADYGSTEGWIGVNLDPASPPEKAVFTVIPTFCYFEFIPLYRNLPSETVTAAAGTTNPDDDFVEGEPVPLARVVVGQQYEIVLTTFTGLYRYRLGDVVEVAGFYKATPQLTFICRRKLILTVNIDKNTERDLQLAVEKGRGLLSRSASKAELVDFTSHADVGRCPGHYVIYWELKGEAEERVLAECCSAMDAAFVDEGYVVSRKTSSIGPLELRIVAGGTFHNILEYFIGHGTAMSQFKTPRCTTNVELLRILDRSTIRRFWSIAYG